MADERLGASFSIDVTNLKTGLAQANRLIRESQSEFKAAAAGLDDWSKSEAGLNAKIKSLSDITEIQKKKVNALKAEYQNLINSGLDPAGREATELRTKINNEEAALKSNQSELKRQIDALEELESASDDAGEAVEDAGESAKESSGGFTVLKGALADLVADGFRLAIDAAKDFAKNMIQSAADVKAANSQFTQTFGDLEETATQAIHNIAESTGILETRLQGTGAGIFAFARSSGASTEEAMELMQKALVATADSAAYYDRSLEDSAETLQSFLKGNFANDAALGVSATEFTRNAKATELFGKKYNDLSEIQKQQTLLQMVIDAQKMSGAMGQAAREADGWENVQGNLNETWKLFQAEVGAPVLEQLIPVIQELTTKFSEWRESVDWDAFGEKVKAFADGVKEGFGWIKDNGDHIIALLAGIGAGFAAFNIATTIMAVVSAVKKAGGALALLNTTMLASPITWIALGVAALVAGIVLLIKNWDKVKEAGAAAWEWIKNAWANASEWFDEKIIQPIANFFSGMWESITTTATNAWNKIVGFFTGMWESIVNAYHTVIDPWIEIVKRISVIIHDTVIQPIIDFFVMLWDRLTEGFRNIYDFILGIFIPIATWFNDNVIHPVAKVFSSMWDKLKSGATKAWEGIKSVFSKVAEFFGNIFSKAWEKVKAVFSTGGKIFDGIKEGIVSVFKTVVNAIIKGINKVVKLPFEGLNKILDRIQNIEIVGIKPFDWIKWRAPIPEIPQLAKGGVLKKATHVVAGEDGTEAVLPLEKNTGWMDILADKIASKEGKAVVVNQTNNYSQAHSRYEIYKSKQQTAAAVRLALGGAK